MYVGRGLYNIKHMQWHTNTHTHKRTLQLCKHIDKKHNYFSSCYDVYYTEWVVTILKKKTHVVYTILKYFIIFIHGTTIKYKITKNYNIIIYITISTWIVGGEY